MQKYALFTNSGDQPTLIEGVAITLPANRGLLVEDSVECGENVSPDTHYIDFDNGTPVVLEKLSLDVAYNVDGMRVVFTSILSGLRVSVGGEEFITEGDGDSIEFDLAGDYEVYISGGVLFRDIKLEVTVG